VRALSDEGTDVPIWLSTGGEATWCYRFFEYM